MKETWKAIEGYEGAYEVSNLGQVRSLDRVVEGPRGPKKLKGRVLKQRTHNKGYRQLKLSKDGKKKTLLVHRLVVLAFLGPPGPGEAVDHKDGDRANNEARNLRWASQGLNNQNMKTPERNKSGVKGVSWHKAAGKWEVQVRLHGKNHYGGLFANLDCAAWFTTKTF
jgi:hypothetical protein